MKLLLFKQIFTISAALIFVIGGETIYERYSDNVYMTTSLPRLLAACRSSTSHMENNLKDCQEVEYLEAVKNMYITLQSKATIGAKVTLPSSIKSFDQSVGFQKLFQENIVPKRLVMLCSEGKTRIRV
jgi:hypothetical protein